MTAAVARSRRTATRATRGTGMRAAPASPARLHLEWLQFAEPTGPFLSLPVLLRAFPQGPEKLASERVEALAERLSEWREAAAGSRPDLAIHRQWCLYVLRELLAWPSDCLQQAGTGVQLPTATAPLGRETLAPDLALVNPHGHTLGAGVRVLVTLHPPGQSLDKPVPDRPWRASPTDRMVELLRGSGVRLGLVTNGAEWRWVHLAAGELPGVATWDVDLWFDERGTLDAFVTMLEARRFFAAAATDTPEALFDESAEHQHEVTVQLGDQVRRAVEVLVQSLDRADRDAGGELLRAVPPAEAYDAALTVMMRLVFLFAAEERGLIGRESPLYQQHLAVSTLLDQLEEAGERHGEEVLETRHDAWARLLATFRAIHGGASHEDLGLPAYGGSLFDPDRYAFLEGRVAGTHWRDTPARPLPVSNRTVLHLLRALQMLEVRTPGAGGEKRRLSFRSLDIENIGHVYEGLLDHTARRAELPDAPVLGLAGKHEPEIPLPRLESERRRGDEKLVEFLCDETGRSATAIERALAIPVVRDEARARRACGNDTGLYDRVRPWLGLVRDDTLADPLIVREGSAYVTAGAGRRTSGTYYTPRTLTEPIVRHALDPVVYEGPAEGRPENEWRLRPVRDLLAFKVCDFAMGSGAFLVQACRYLADRLVEAWEVAEHAGPEGVRITPEGERSSGDPRERLIPLDPEERRVVAMRLVADRSLYGVDRNPMAVEMAKLSLWLATLQKDRPFNFLDHALRCGDSLLGVTRVEQLEEFDLAQRKGAQVPMVAELLRPALAEAAAKRRELEGFPVLDITDAERKAALLAEADAKLTELRTIADLLVGCALAGEAKGADAGALLGGARNRVAAAFDARLSAEERGSRIEALAVDARRMLDAGKPAMQAARRPFHWMLEFPEVFEQGGFDAMVANPPFKSGQHLSGLFGSDYRDHAVNVIANGIRGSADLSAYFMLRAVNLLRDGGMLGMIATNTISQGGTGRVGLHQLLGDGFASPRAVSSQKWPGDASTQVAVLWVHRGVWGGAHVLDGTEVRGITSSLTGRGAIEGEPYRLLANAGKSFQGSIVLGMGFVLMPEESAALIAREIRNRDVLFPYLNGEDLNSRWDQSPSRCVINFRDWPLDRESASPGYRGPVATDYPDCLSIVEEKVRAERESNRYSRSARKSWWLYERLRPELYAAITGMERVICVAATSRTLAYASTEVGSVIANTVYVFACSRSSWLAVLMSEIGRDWVFERCSTFKTDLRYTNVAGFETFPFPPALDFLDPIGFNYDTHRRSIMTTRREGLTTTYNRFHSPDERSPDIATLRELHVEMDRAVATAYGWTDLDLGHGFHATKQGVRFTVSDPARREILGRLLTLNHERYSQEVEQGLHDKGAKKKSATGKTRPRRAKPAPSSGSLFD